MLSSYLDSYSMSSNRDREPPCGSPQALASNWMMNGPSDGNNMLVSTARPQDNHNSNTGINDNANMMSGKNQQNQPGPAMQDESSQMEPTNNRQYTLLQHQNFTTAQALQPGQLIPQQQQQMLQHQQYMAQLPVHQPQAPSPPYQGNSPFEMARQHLHQQLDVFINQMDVGQFNFGNQDSVPIERSQSDMGPQPSMASFPSSQSAASDQGSRPGTSRSMVDFRQAPHWPTRPHTPFSQIIGSSNAPSPASPATPPHQMASEAIDLTDSSAASPRPQQSVNGARYGPIEISTRDFASFPQPSNHASHNSSVDLTNLASPSKALGNDFSRLNFSDSQSFDIEMGNAAINETRTSDDDGSDAPLDVSKIEPPVIEVDTGYTDEYLMSYLRDRKGEKDRFECIKCGDRIPRPENAKNHVQKHFGIRPFKCGICELTFIRKHDAKRHAKGHFKDLKKFRCGCNFAQSRHDAYVRHMSRNCCPYMKEKNPDLVKPSAKRGRPKNGAAKGSATPKTPRTRNANENRVTKTPSPSKKLSRKRQQELKQATQAMFPASPTPTHRSIQSEASIQSISQLSYASVDQTGSQQPQYGPLDFNEPSSAASPSHTDASDTPKQSQKQQGTNGPAQSLRTGLAGSFTFPGVETPSRGLFDQVDMLLGSFQASPMTSSFDDDFSCGVASPAKQGSHGSPVAGDSTPPGSPPDLSNSPAPSSMGAEELPSNVFGNSFDDPFVDLFGPVRDFNNGKGDADLFGGEYREMSTD